MRRYDIQDRPEALALAASGTVVPTDWEDASWSAPGAPLTMRMTQDAETRRNGETVMGSLREVIKRLHQRGTGDEVAVRTLRKIVSLAPGLVIRSPDFLEYMAALLRANHHHAVAQILSVVRRGRPLQHHQYLVAMIDLVKQQGARSIAVACKKLRDLPNSPFKDIQVDRMRNIYGEQHELFAAMRSYHVSEQDLAQVPRDLFDDLLGILKR